MPETFSLIIKNTIPVTSTTSPLSEERTDIGIKEGKIAHIGPLSRAQADQVLDAHGLYTLPGLIDTQVHFREPGFEYKETIASGTRAALLGGVTGIFEMPNTSPPTTTLSALKDKLQRAQKSAWCHYAFYVGACSENINHLQELEQVPGCCGVKVFVGSSTGSLLMSEPHLIKKAMLSGSKRMAFHCEDETRLRERKPLLKEQTHNPSFHPIWRDEKTALLATQMIVQLAHETQRPTHILHVSTKEEMLFLKKEKKGDLISVEVTPQHLTLHAPDCYQELGTLAQMNPPIRSLEHQKALWEGLVNNTVDIVASDHAPHTLEEKNKPYPQSPSGMPGVQTIVPLMLHHVAEKRLSLQRLVQLMAENPARLFGIPNKGRVAIGYDADLTLVDLSANKVITNQSMASLSQWTPFAGLKVKGWPIATILNGEIAMHEGELTLSQPIGCPYTFKA
ncbi:MAG: dihydroorotase [Bdellovibrio sp.]|nr:MAG: dihydroorotase [Bdellovibrio sp.]